MIYEFAYGKNSFKLDLEGDLEVLDCKNVNFKEFPVKEYISKIQIKGKKIGIIIPDTTRPLPAKEILDNIYPKIKDKTITLFIANGTHRKTSEKETINYLGHFKDKFKLVFNEPEIAKKYSKIGITSYGTQVEIQKEVLRQEQLICFAVSRPHYYAGYSGGRKIFLPGISSMKTIQQNHRLVLDKDPSKGKNPSAVLGVLKENPVHIDMMEALKFIPVPYEIHNFVILNEKIIFGTKDFIKAVNFIKKNFELKTKEKFDTLIISAGGAPYDINFIQGHKCLEDSIGALKKGGSIFAYIEAGEGFGSEDCKKFLKLGSIENISKNLRLNFKVYGHTALTIKMKAENYDINLCTKLSDEDVKLMGYKKWDGLNLPKNLGRVGIIRQGSIFYFSRNFGK